jgi:hypothetical protein
MLVLGDDHIGDQSGGSITAHRRPGQSRRNHGSLLTLALAPELRAHDLALDQLRSNQLHLEGSLLADLFKGIRRFLHLIGQDFHNLDYRKMRKHLRRHRTFFSLGLAPLIVHGLLGHLSLGCLRQAQLDLLARVHHQLLAFGPKHLTAIPRQLRLHFLHLCFKRMDFGVEFFGCGHYFAIC